MILLIYRICKNDTNEVTYKTENNKPTALKKTYGYQRGKGEVGQIVISYSHIYKTIYKIDNQQGCNIKHRELYSIFQNNLKGKEVLNIYV